MLASLVAAVPSNSGVPRALVAPAATPPSTVRVVGVSLLGSGCPPNTADVQIDAGKTLMEVTFSEYISRRLSVTQTSATVSQEWPFMPDISHFIIEPAKLTSSQSRRVPVSSTALASTVATFINELLRLEPISALNYELTFLFPGTRASDWRKNCKEPFWTT